MAEIPDEPNASRKLTSSLHHQVDRQRLVDGTVEVQERRGIRKATWQSPSSTGGTTRDVERTFGLMTIAANQHLRAAGEMDAFAVMETAEGLAVDYPTAEKISEHMLRWAEKLKNERGILSIDATAAKFLEAADRLLQILNKTPEMQEAAFEFADAWHWWHLELYGEHELAAKADIAERAVAGLQAGPEALKRSRALREAIIEAEYDNYAATADEIDRLSPKRSAGAILGVVAIAFGQQGLGSIQESTLERALRQIIKDRGQIDDR
ncbi:MULTISPECIES: hypothetical protein [unclassified Bradyrhizobium]|uniref:hypothetical protein n=1 Tax=unclassified Bradyrhizobium TaxID=2631580 RepID=UPI003397A712